MIVDSRTIETAAALTVLLILILVWHWHATPRTRAKIDAEFIETRWTADRIETFHRAIIAEAGASLCYWPQPCPEAQVFAVNPSQFLEIWKRALCPVNHPQMYLHAYNITRQEAARFHLKRDYPVTLRARQAPGVRPYRLPADHGLVPLFQCYDLPQGDYFVRLESDTFDGVTIPCALAAIEWNGKKPESASDALWLWEQQR